MPDYLTLNAREADALARCISPDVASIQLSRRDSLDNLHAEGFLIVSVVPRDPAELPFRVAIGGSGQTSNWS